MFKCGREQEKGEEKKKGKSKTMSKDGKHGNKGL